MSTTFKVLSLPFSRLSSAWQNPDNSRTRWFVLAAVVGGTGYAVNRFRKGGGILGLFAGEDVSTDKGKQAAMENLKEILGKTAADSEFLSTIAGRNELIASLTGAFNMLAQKQGPNRGFITVDSVTASGNDEKKSGKISAYLVLLAAFSLMDLNCDNRLSYEEFMKGAVLGYVALWTSSERLIREFSFHVIDMDHDGVITPREIIRWMKYAAKVDPNLYVWTENGVTRPLDPNGDAEKWDMVMKQILGHCGKKDGDSINLTLDEYMDVSASSIPLGGLILRKIFSEGLGHGGMAVKAVQETTGPIQFSKTLTLSASGGVLR